MNYQEARAWCTSYEKLAWSLAQEACRKAGLDPSMAGLHTHNAIVSESQGCPWPEVDYRYAHIAYDLLHMRWEPFRAVEGWARRHDREDGPFWMTRRANV